MKIGHIFNTVSPKTDKELIDSQAFEIGYWRREQEFKGSEALLFGAGKFMILAKNENNHKIKDIQKELDSYFLKNFFGQNGFILSSTETTREKLLNQKNMKSDLDALGVDNDNKKLNKFDLLNVEDDDILIDPFENSTILHKSKDLIEKAYYNTFNRFGKYHSTSTPFKKPLLMADSGAVVKLKSQKQYIGGDIANGIKSQSLVQGYSIVVPFKLKGKLCD